MPSDYDLLDSIKSDPLADEFQLQQFVDEKSRIRPAFLVGVSALEYFIHR